MRLEALLYPAQLEKAIRILVQGHRFQVAESLSQGEQVFAKRRVSFAEALLRLRQAQATAR